jgi:hypothetical protein
MAIRIKLSDGTEMLVEATLEQLTQAVRTANETGDMITIDRPNGRTMTISPQAIETMSEEPEAEAVLAERFGRSPAAA